MGRFTLLLGIVLILVAVVVLVVGLQFSDNEITKTVLESLYCNENEQATHELGGMTMTDTGFGQSVHVYCEDTTGENTRREITDEATVLLIASFVVPFIFGLLMSISSVSAIVRRNLLNLRPLSQLSQDGTVINMHSGQQANIPPEALETIQQVFSKIGTAVQSAAPKQELSDRLKQLKEAYDEGLISRSEYDRVREALLDNFDEPANQ